VLGANSSGLVVLLNRDFTKLILIAIIIAIPAGYLGSREWVSSFPYQIEPGVFKFLLAGVGSNLIAWLKVGYQSIRAAKANPVDSIRNE